jgi:hypothetical protein
VAAVGADDANDLRRRRGEPGGDRRDPVRRRISGVQDKETSWCHER